MGGRGVPPSSAPLKLRHWLSAPWWHLIISPGIKQPFFLQQRMEENFTFFMSWWFIFMRIYLFSLSLLANTFSFLFWWADMVWKYVMTFLRGQSRTPGCESSFFFNWTIYDRTHGYEELRDEVNYRVASASKNCKRQHHSSLLLLLSLSHLSLISNIDAGKVLCNARWWIQYIKPMSCILLSFILSYVCVYHISFISVGAC